MATPVLPGDIIGSIDTHHAGRGTHSFGSNVCASVVGYVESIPSSSSRKPTMIVSHKVRPTAWSTFYPPNALPTLNSTVLCRVTRVQQRQATASILCIDPSQIVLLTDSLKHLSVIASNHEDGYFAAVLRREDVRFTEKDKIVMNESLRVGDIIRATVISLGDEKSYYISTGGNENGVVVAISEDGNAMLPASWREMRDEVTAKREPRKVARPI